MYITVFELNYKDKRTSNSIMNRHEMHRDVQTLFGNDRNSSKNVYRVIERKGKMLIYLYSEKPVDKTRAHFGMKFLGEGKVPMRKAGEKLHINMLVTPIKTIQCEDGKKRKRPIFDGTERLTWCRRKAKEYGFEIEEISEVKKETFQIDKHDGDRPWIVDAYEYKLSATVINEEAFSDCMLNGFGRNGSYGAGMIIIA